jgi:hypothetical protein
VVRQQDDQQQQRDLSHVRFAPTTDIPSMSLDVG